MKLKALKMSFILSALLLSLTGCLTAYQKSLVTLTSVLDNQTSLIIKLKKFDHTHQLALLKGSKTSDQAQLLLKEYRVRRNALLAKISMLQSQQDQTELILSSLVEDTSQILLLNDSLTSFRALQTDTEKFMIAESEKLSELLNNK